VKETNVNEPKKYRKKPVIIEAIQFTGSNQDNVKRFCSTVKPADFEMTALVIPTLEGDMRVDAGDYVIKGVKGEFYPCKADIFNMTYEPEQV
jgi:hypothetical protein